EDMGPRGGQWDLILNRDVLAFNSATRLVLKAASASADSACVGFARARTGACSNMASVPNAKAVARVRELRAQVPLECAASAASGLVAHAVLAGHATGKKADVTSVDGAQQALNDTWVLSAAVLAAAEALGATAAVTELRGARTWAEPVLKRTENEEASGLTFDRGDIIEVLACLESGWWNGICGTNRGWFPSNYVEQVSSEQVQILRQAAHLQHQQLPSIPVASETAASVAQPADQSAINNDIGNRRGSLADTQAGVASAVPSRLRTGRRPSSPHNALLLPSSEGDGTAMVSVRSRSDSVDLNGSIVSPRGLSSSSVHTAEAVHVAQWESRVTLDGRTYYCNIFTDKTMWTLAADGGDAGGVGSRGAELIGDEATLVYVSLVMGRNDSGARRDMAGSDLHVLAGSGLSAAGAWDQMAAGIALAAFALASSVSARAKHEYLGLLTQVVAGVKRLLLS
ncbi:hypothetical protein GGI24_004489, partial [Coemansia furcata]